jgi:hypothetical protein
MATPLEDTAGDRVVRQCCTTSKVLCVVALAFPFLVALGWIFDLPLLKQGHVRLPAMQPNTAAGLALAALALLLTPGLESASCDSVSHLSAGARPQLHAE